MINIPQISWREYPGYKFNKPIDSAMLSDEGFIAPTRFKANHYTERTFHNVVYDKEYFLRKLIKMIVEPLEMRGRETVHQLIDEAWDLYEKQMIDPKA